MKKSNTYLIISWILVIIWMLVIFAFSAVNSEKSVSSSVGAISKTVDVAGKILYKVRIIQKPLRKEKINEIAEFLNLPARKAMHMSEFFVLTVLLYNALAFSKIKKSNILSFLISVLYSVTDEIHQLFTMRNGSIIDVLIDCIGIMAALGFIHIIKKSFIKN